MRRVNLNFVIVVLLMLAVAILKIRSHTGKAEAEVLSKQVADGTPIIKVTPKITLSREPASH